MAKTEVTVKGTTFIEDVMDLLVGFASTFVPGADEALYTWSKRLAGNGNEAQLAQVVLDKGMELIRKAYKDNDPSKVQQKAEALMARLARVESADPGFAGSAKKIYSDYVDKLRKEANNASQAVTRAYDAQSNAVADAQSRAALAQNLASQPNSRNLRTIDHALGTSLAKKKPLQTLIENTVVQPLSSKIYGDDVPDPNNPSFKGGR